MGLHQNGFRDNIGVFRYAGVGFSNGSYPSTLPINTHLTGSQRNITAGQGIPDDNVGIPLGYLAGGSWVMPQKAGNMSARYTANLSISGSGLAVGGVTSNATASITITIADADGQLISSGTGSASLTFTVASLLLTASLNGTGSSSITLNTNTPLLGAEASVLGNSMFSISGTLTPYAIGSMSGSTVDSGTLTVPAIVDGVWNSIATSYNTAGTMGNKLNSAASGGGGGSGSALTLPQFLALKD